MTDPGAPDAPYQSLYRRFRPQRFEEVLGQHHVSTALRNAVREGRVGHAYLFSGPRGTGKTSTARILAKALNCAAVSDGEPCGRCPSCLEITRGASLDVHELDAASNNGVDAMRDLVAHAALGTPGRWKVYIVDEVHMLSTAASNALLKTLEEPPGHVVFVLATTDPQKVLPTIRSRTQHFEFRLLAPDVLAGLLGDVSRSAGLELGEDAIEAAVRRGRGSARDALSALDQVAAGGAVVDDMAVLAELADALADRDAARTLVAVASAAAAGRDPLRIAGDLCDHLRQGFLAAVAPELIAVTGAERAHAESLPARMGLGALVRALEEIGQAQVSMRDAPDPRVHLEVVLIRLTHPEADDSAAALLQRVERLERAVTAGAAPAPGAGGVGAGSGLLAAGATGPAGAAATRTPPAGSAPAPTTGTGSQADGAGATPAADPAAGAATSGPLPARPEVAEPPAGSRRRSGPAAGPAAAAGEARASEPTGGPQLARQSLGALRRAQRSGEVDGGAAPARRFGASAAAPPVTTGTAPAGAPTRRDDSPAGPAVPARGERLPDRDALVEAWGDGLLAALPARARARYRVGRFMAVEDGVAVFALPNDTHRSYCEEVRRDVEAALQDHFGMRVPLRLVVDDDASPAAAGESGPAAPAAPAEEEPLDDEPDLLDPEVLAAETEPAGAALSVAERLKQAFPGAEEV